ALPVGVEPVVVVAVDVAERVFVALGLEADHPDPTEVRGDRFDLGDDRGALGRVRGPSATAVGALVTLLPESLAVELAVGGRDRREVRVPSALPVHVLQTEVLALVDRRGEVAEHDLTLPGER